MHDYGMLEIIWELMDHKLNTYPKNKDNPQIKASTQLLTASTEFQDQEKCLFWVGQTTPSNYNHFGVLSWFQ